MNPSSSQRTQRILAGCAGAILLGLAGVAAPAWAQTQWDGVPRNGFPNWDERTLLVLVNRDRADPQTSLAGCTAANCPDKACYAPVPPVGWDYDLNRSSRFHSANLVASHSPLQHPSPCLLQSNIAQIYPASCDGSPSCACSGAVKCACASGCSCDSSLSSCVTQPFERIQAFNPLGCAENIAAGYPDPVAVEQGFLLEPCSCCTNTCPAQYVSCPNGDVNGHRVNILSGGNALLGTGETPNGTLGCYGQGNWYTQDYGCGVPGPTKLVAGTHYPQTGTSFTFWANWFDTGTPFETSVVIDGATHPMTRERGSAANATWAYQGTVAAGCHPYYFFFKDSASVTYILPAVGAYLVGDSCTADYTAGGGTGGTTGGGTGGGTSTSGGNTSGGGTGSGGSTSGSGSDAGLGVVVSSGWACTTTARSESSAELLLVVGATLLARRRRR